MKPQKVLYHWGRSVGMAFPHLSKPQVFVLAAFSLGVAWAKSCSLSRIAQSLAILGTLPTVERRLQRFLSNPRIDPHQGSVCLAQWVVPLVVPALVWVGWPSRWCCWWMKRP